MPEYNALNHSKLNSPEAEMSVIGLMMLDPESLAHAMSAMIPEMLCDPAHREIYNAITALTLKGSPVDLVTLDSELTTRGTLDKIGGINYLLQTIQRLTTTANLTAYLKIVRDLYQMRKLRDAARLIHTIVQEYTGDTAPILAKAQQALYEASLPDTTKGIRHIKKPLMDVYEQASDRAGSEQITSGIPTGILGFDDLTDGLQGGQLIIIGARPSMGKTSFALNIVANAANAGKPCVLFSLEMPIEQIAQRLLCGKAFVELRKFTSGKLESDEWERLAVALGIVSAAPIWVDDTSVLTPMQLLSRLRLAIMQHKIQFAVIDYLQIMRSDSRHRNRVDEVTDITRSLKAIALELNIPLIVCAQLSRANASRADKRPMLSDLRDSGSIEQDADIVMFLHRESYYDRDASPEQAELIISKNRNGQTGIIDMIWEAKTMTYMDAGKGIT